MAVIPREILREILMEARKYVRALKGDNITREDIMVAENLMVFGYKRGTDALEKHKLVTKTVKENLEAINSEWE